MKEKILYIHQYFCTPEEASGTRSYWISRALIENGYSVTMIAGRTSQINKFEEEDVDVKNKAIKEKLADPLQMYSCDILIAGASLAGLPALSVPCGLAGGLPVGLQITGPPLSEEKVLGLGAAYQELTDWHRREPLP